MSTIGSRLCKDGAETTCVSIVAEGGVSDESILPVPAGVRNDGLRAEDRLKFAKRFHSGGRQLIVNPGCIFMGKCSERSQKLCKILNMSLEKIT